MTEQSADSNYLSNKKSSTPTNKLSVKFVSKVDIRHYEGNLDDNDDVTIKDENAFFEDQNSESFTNISFENSTRKFIIDDDFYKVQKKIPKTIDQIKYFNEKVSNSATQLEKTKIKNQIIAIYNTLLDASKMKVMDRDVNHRVDGILYEKDKKLLVIITDKYIIRYKYNLNQFEEEKKVLITHIDYITLTRDHNTMILHLVEEAKQENFILTTKHVHRVVGCLCSTFFYDKHNYSYPKDKMVMRKTPVILINSNMVNLIEKLEQSAEFCDYREEFNDFLDKRIQTIKEVKINPNTYVYTCIHYKDCKYEAFEQGDFILDTHALYIFNYIAKEDIFELIIRVYLKDINKMDYKTTKHSITIFDTIVFPGGLEIKSNNYRSLQELITNNIHTYNK